MNLIPFHEALARAMASITDQTLEYCRGCVIATHKEQAPTPEDDASFQQLVPEEIVEVIAKKLQQPAPEGEKTPELTYVERIRRRSMSASYGLAQMLADDGLDPRIYRPMSREEIRKLLFEQGCGAYAISYAHTQDDIEAVNVAFKCARARDNTALELLLESDQCHQFFACARWADQAFPLVQLSGHRYAAALMSTHVPETMDVRPPWKAFLIDVPDGLVEVEGPDGAMHSVTYVLVHTHEGFIEDGATPTTLWTMFALAGPSVLHRYNQTLTNFLKCAGPPSDDYAFSIPLGNRDERAVELLSRLVMSVCVAMSDPDRIKPLGKHPKGWTRGPGHVRGAKTPEFRTFRVGKPIELDCRPAVRSYLEGHRRGPASVQFLVRGHWRDQPYGPKRTLRKTIWIEPFWKGPEDAPINMRAHVMTDDTAEPTPVPPSAHRPG